MIRGRVQNGVVVLGDEKALSLGDRGGRRAAPAGAERRQGRQAADRPPRVGQPRRQGQANPAQCGKKP